MSRPLFQKRHYQALAETLRSVKPVSLYSQPNKTTLAAMLAWESAVVQTAKTLRQDNPAFDMAKFLKAADANTLPFSKQS
ncbi:MAG: hypothetical protein ACK5PR_03340 [bacterium]|jgi:hypothetical protein